LLRHAVERFDARFLEQFRVPRQLAADDVLQARHDVATDVLGADRAAGHHAVESNDAHSRNGFGVAVNHGDLRSDE
jgi:hypothetical protein